MSPRVSHVACSSTGPDRRSGSICPRTPGWLSPRPALRRSRLQLEVDAGSSARSRRSGSHARVDYCLQAIRLANSPGRQAMKAIQLEQPKQFRVIDVPEPAAPGTGRRGGEGVPRRHLRHRLHRLPRQDAVLQLPRIPGHELGVEVVAVGRGRDEREGRRPGRGRAVHQLPEVLLVCSRAHQLLREPPDARRPRRRRPAPALHGPRAQAARLHEAHLRATGARGNARHRPARDQPREPASRTRPCS